MPRAAYALAALLAQDVPATGLPRFSGWSVRRKLGDPDAQATWNRHALPLAFDPTQVLPDEASKREALWRAAARQRRCAARDPARYCAARCDG